MSLNNIVQANTLYTDDRKLNVKFDDTLTTTTTFNDSIFGVKGQLKCIQNANATQNDLVYRNEENQFQVLSNARQRLFQQLAPEFAITGTTSISLYDLQDRIGNKIIYIASLRRGSSIQLEGYGHITTASSGQLLYFELTFGETIIIDTTFSLPNLPTGSDYEYQIESIFYETGDTGLVKTHGKFDFIDAQGNSHHKFFDSSVPINTDIDLDIDIRCKWGSSGNNLTIYRNDIYVLI